jgi:predicted ABC-type ATPase/GNAT superfamily N-acetyltransferase
VQDDKYGLEPATTDDKYGLEPAGTATATAEQEPPSDEEIEKAYGKDVTPKIRTALKTGVAKMQPPTNFEKENARPFMGNFGLKDEGEPLSGWDVVAPHPRVLKEAAKGAWDLAKGTAGAAYDLGLGEVNPDTGNIEGHGLGGLIGMNQAGEVKPLERAGALTRKFITDPAVAELDKGNEEGGVAGAGHKLAAAVPLLGPWAASLGERAGSGDVAGAGAEGLGQIAAGAAAEKLPNVKDVAKKVVTGTPITEAGKLEAAKQQALAVKKPSMSEHEYIQSVNDALPELQRIAQDNKGQIKTPRDAVGAINKRIGQLEQPIANHLENDPIASTAVVHPDEYQDQISDAIDHALSRSGEKLTPEEKLKAKQAVMDYIGEGDKTLKATEDHRQRLNQDSEAYFSSKPADRRMMNSSDATAIAQRAAADKIRDIQYGDRAGTTPGKFAENGINAVDVNGQQVPIREVRKTVGRLIDIRDHFEDAVVKAELTGDWKPFENVFKGPSLAAGGAGVLAGAAAGGPFGALLGMLGGEGLKIWGDYLRSKNPNLNVQKMFRNLEATGKPNTIDVTRRTPNATAQPYGPQPLAFSQPIGPELPAAVKGPPFEVQGGPGGTVGAPQQTPQGNWQPQVGALPPISFEPPAPKVEPIRPDTAWKLGNIGVSDLPPAGRQLPAPVPEANQLPMPGAAELAHPEMFPKSPMTVEAVPHAPRRSPESGKMMKTLFKGEGKGKVIGQTAEGGPIREGTLGRIGGEPEVRPELGKLGRIETTTAEKLKEGDTFVDEKGDPRRITEITEDGTIKTADHTMRDYKDGEIKHLGEINSPKAQLARGGIFHPPGEAVEGVGGKAEKKAEAETAKPPEGTHYSEIDDSEDGPGWKQFYVLNQKGLPKAHMIISPEGDALAVRLVRTMEGSEGQGFGTAAYNRAIEYAKEHGFKRLISDPEGGTAEGAASIWRKLGAEEAGKKGKPSFSLDLGENANKELAPGQSTYDKYYNKETDQWAPERQAIHDKVAADAVKGKTYAKDRPPEAIITVGGTAAGKTTLTREIMGEDPHRVNIDSDANKLHVPEYKGLQKSNPKKAAALVHDESKAISKRVIQEAVKNGLDFVYDTSTGGGGEGLFQKLKDLGYKVKLVYADIPTEEAVSRANKRAKESSDPINRGRFVPEDVVRKKHVEAARAFRTFIDSPHVDEIRAFDTTTRKPKEFFRRDHEGEKVLDEEAMNRIKEKANERIHARK